ncbi:hypothetical protein P4O66_016849, partial [Electrophorus voltai]
EEAAGWRIWSRVRLCGVLQTQPDSEDRHTEMDSAGSYDPYMDFYKGYADYGDNGECSDVSLWSDLGFDYGEEPPMEVEEVLCGDSPNVSDVESADYESDEPPALKIPPKALPRRCRSGASKLSRVAQSEVTAFEEESPFTRPYSPRTRAPVPKPRRGKEEATPVPAPETGRATGAPPVTLCSFVSVPVTGSVPITLSVPVALSPFVSVPVPVSVSVPVSVIVLIPVHPPHCPARAGPCRVAWSPGLVIGRWGGGGLCHGTAPPPERLLVCLDCMQASSALRLFFCKAMVL